MNWLPAGSLAVDRVLEGVEMRPGGSAIGGSTDILELRKRIDLDFIDFEWVGDAHRHSIRPLIGQMPPDSGAEHLVCLSDVDWFAVIIVEDVDAPSIVADAALDLSLLN